MDTATQRWARRFDLPVVLAALATVPLLVFERRHLGAPAPTLLRVGDWLVWTVFAVEAVVMTAVAPSKPGWLKDHPLDVAIVLLTIPVIPAAVQALRVLRLLRLLRLVRVGPLSRRVFSLSGLRYASFLALLAMLGGGTAFASVEKTSLGNGIYWALSTMTTVGYGDYVPRTATGKAVAAVVMVLGVAFFAMITGAIAQRFLAGEVAEIEQEVGEVEEMVQETEREELRVQAGQAQMLAELHELGERLQTLEDRLRGHFQADAG